MDFKYEDLATEEGEFDPNDSLPPFASDFNKALDKNVMRLNC
jgi:hypothetical protein